MGKKSLTEKPALDELDRYILKILQIDGQLSLRKIAEQIEKLYNEKFSISTISKRIEALSGSGVIKDIIARVECSMIGYREMTLFFLRVNPSVSIEEIGETLANMKVINGVYQTTGTYSLFCIAKCVEKNEQLNLINEIKKIEGIDEISTEVVLRKFKEDFRVRIPDSC